MPPFLSEERTGEPTLLAAGITRGGTLAYGTAGWLLRGTNKWLMMKHCPYWDLVASGGIFHSILHEGSEITFAVLEAGNLLVPLGKRKSCPRITS